MALGSNSFTFGTFNVNLDSTLDNTTITNPMCLAGHRVDGWVEYLDGLCAGYCANCGQRVTTSREPGGLPFIRLKALIERFMASPEDIALALEAAEIDALLDAEQRAIDDARSLLVTARRMLECKD